MGADAHVDVVIVGGVHPRVIAGEIRVAGTSGAEHKRAHQHLDAPTPPANTRTTHAAAPEGYSFSFFKNEREAAVQREKGGVVNSSVGHIQMLAPPTAGPKLPRLARHGQPRGVLPLGTAVRLLPGPRATCASGGPRTRAGGYNKS
eukprot:COSAG04_NODE_1760_length_5665_cov_4.392203_4_plen_146_part_00